MNDNQAHLVKRPTSRVLAPPGGHTSFSLGTVPLPKKKAPVAVVAPAPTPPVPAPVVVAKAPTPPTTVAAPKLTASTLKNAETKSVLPAAQPISSNAFASGASMNGAQVMTGRPSSRVLAPPGGHTTFKLG